MNKHALALARRERSGVPSVTFDEVKRAYAEQARGLLDGGATRC
jgi:methionine synthase I (cobalamin-dependent)